MSEILLLNAARKRRKKRSTHRKTRKASTRRRPARKRRKVASKRKPVARRVAETKGVTSMAKRRRKRRTTRRAPRRNPSSRRTTKRVARRASGAFHGLNFRSALKNIPMNTLGMFAAKWAAKRFPSPGMDATEGNPGSWNYASYIKGALGAASAGFLANMAKRGTGQRVLEGGMSLMLYKLLQNEFIQGSGSWWETQFGADEDYERVPGTVEANSAGEYYVLGEDYQWRPIDGADDYRMEPELYGELVEPGPLGLGDALVEPGPLGYGASADVDQLYSRSFLRR